MQFRPQQQVRRQHHALALTWVGLVMLCLVFVGMWLRPMPTSGAGLTLAPSLTVNPASHPLFPDKTTANQILITQNGFVPTTLTTTVSIPVTWLNTTASTHILRSGIPHRIYLPMVSRNGNSVSATGNDNDPSQPPDPPRGRRGICGHVVARDELHLHVHNPGTFPFYLATAFEYTGVIVVVPDGAVLPPDPATVAPPLDQTVSTGLLDATAFLYTGNNPIQTGVVSGTIELQRVAVLRGKVRDPDATQQLARRADQRARPSRIRPDAHPRRRHVRSRRQRRRPASRCATSRRASSPAQRQVAPWQDYAWLPDVVMIPLDSRVTTIDLGVAAMQVARGSVVSDTDRRAPGDDPVPPGHDRDDGAVRRHNQPADDAPRARHRIHGRRNGPEAMPASCRRAAATPMPRSSAWMRPWPRAPPTCASANPLPVYVENFLGFPVGGAVPAGYLRPARGQWIASANGRVIKVLSITGGLADLDLDGNGAAAMPPRLGRAGHHDCGAGASGAALHARPDAVARAHQPLHAVGLQLALSARRPTQPLRAASPPKNRDQTNRTKLCGRSSAARIRRWASQCR